MNKGPWLSSYVLYRIDPLPINLIEAELEEHKATNIIKVDIRRNPLQSTLETCKVNMSTFDDGQTEELLALLRN